jgi:hypothetical protein
MRAQAWDGHASVAVGKVAATGQDLFGVMTTLMAFRILEQAIEEKSKLRTLLRLSGFLYSFCAVI